MEGVEWREELALAQQPHNHMVLISASSSHAELACNLTSGDYSLVH